MISPLLHFQVPQKAPIRIFVIAQIAQIVLSSLGADQGEAAMNVSIGDRWQGFVDRVVTDGRYASASEVVREGLRLVGEREAKLVSLRTMLNASIAAGGEVTDAELDDAIAKQSAELRSRSNFRPHASTD
jgi:antitoxin ParD1/3/4